MCAHVVVLLTSGVGREKILGGGADRERFVCFLNKSFMLFSGLLH